MIDTKELRRKLRSDDLVDHVDIHANVKSVLAELINSLEAAEKERDFAKAEIARLHDDIHELTDVRVLDKEDRDRIVAHLQGEAKVKLDRLEATEKELAELRSSMKFRTSLIGRTEAERDVLRAKVEHMEQQEPVLWQVRTRPTWNATGWSEWRDCCEEHAKDVTKAPMLHDWLYEARVLYALPGAKGE